MSVAGGQAGNGSARPGVAGPGRDVGRGAGPGGRPHESSRGPMSAMARVAAPAPAPRRADTAAPTAVRRLAPQLGLEPGSVRLLVDDHEGGALGHSPAGASAEGIQLRPSVLLSPSLPLLVHELAHLAQHRNRTRPPSATAHLAATAGLDITRPDVTAAEAEAAALAAAFAAGRQLWIPRTVLPDGHLARLDGSVGVAPAQPSTSGPGKTPAGLPFDKLVELNHQGEIKRMKNELGGMWELARARREVVLGLLDPHRFVVARAMVRALTSDERRFLALVDDAQHHDHPSSAIAALAALDKDDIKALGDRLTQGWGAPLHGVDPGRLGPAALRGLYAVLQGQSQRALERLVGGDRRDEFRGWLDTPVPWGDEQADIDAARPEEERLGEARGYSLSTDRDKPPGTDRDLVEHVRELLKHRNAEQARQAVAALIPLTEGIEEESGLPPGATDRPRPPKNTPVRPSERMRAVVSELDGDGLIDVILDELPEADRYKTGPDPSQRYGTVLAAVLAARAPSLSLGRIESLLSYGILDWAITDSDARFAYFLVRSLPLEEQDRWRRLDDSKWFHRLEDNLPDGMVESGEYTGVGTEYLPTGLAGRPPGEVLKLLSDVLGNWKAAKNEATALSIIKQLAPEPAQTTASVAGSTTKAGAAAGPGAGSAGTRTVLVPATASGETRIAVVRRLDTLGVIDEILTHVSDRDMVSDEGRHAIRRLAAMRDPVRLEEQVTRLLQTGITDWAISGREAWLAMLLLRSLPPTEQRRWDLDHPGEWSDMLAAMSEDMRQSDAVGALTGRDGLLDLAELRMRIEDRRLWDGKHNPQLRSLIIMAYAADDRLWVFEQSRKYADLLGNVGAAFVADLRLYDPVHRATYEEEPLAVPGFGAEVVSVLGAVGRKLLLRPVGSLVLFLFLLAHPKRTIDTQFDLQTVQWLMGGDISGAQLTDRQKAVVGGDAKRQRELRAQTNELEVHLDPGAGAFLLRLPRLELNQLNITRPGQSYRTGKVVLQKLEIRGDFSDRDYQEPVGFDFSMDRADVSDAVLASDSFGVLALAHLLLSMLKLRSGATGAEDLAAHPPRKGTVGIPLFGPLLQAIHNTVLLIGGFPWPANFSVSDWALLSVPFQGTFIQRHLASGAAGGVANALVTTPEPAAYVYGLFTDGTLRPPRTVLERMSDALRMIRSLSVSFTDLDISGFSIGTKVQLGSIQVHDVTLGLARSLPSHLRLLIQSLNRRIPNLTGPQRDAAIAQRDAALDQLDRLTMSALAIRGLRDKKEKGPGKFTDHDQAELDRLSQAQDEVVARRRKHRTELEEQARKTGNPAAVEDPAQYLPETDAEVEMERLERKDRWIAGSLKPEEQKQLADLNKMLRADLGATLDVGGIDVGEVSGAVELAGAKVDPIHLDLRVPDTLLPGFSGDYLADPELVARFKEGGRRTPTGAELGKSAQVNLTVAGIKLKPDPSGVVLRIPPGELPTAAELQDRIKKLPPQVKQQIRDRLTEAGKVARQMEEARGQKDSDVRVAKLKERLRQLMSVEVRQLSVGPVAGGLDPATGDLTAKVADVDAKDIIGPQVMIDHATGSVEVGAALTGMPGTVGAEKSWKDFATSLHPRVGADLNLKNVQTAFGSAKNIAIKGLRGTVQPLAGGARIPDLVAESVELSGLVIFSPSASITGANVRVDGLSADVLFQVTGEGDARTTELTATDLRIRQIAGDKLSYVAATSEGTRQLTVEATHGVLGGIQASRISYRQVGGDPAEITAEGTAGTVDVQYQVISELLSGGDRTTVTGTLTGGPGTLAGPGKAPVSGPALTVGFVQDAHGRTIMLDAPALLAADNLVTTPDASVMIRRLPIKVHAELKQDEKGDTTEASGTVDLYEIEIGQVNWHSTTASLTSTGGSTIAAAHIEASYLGARPATGTGKAKPPTLKVKSCRIDGIDVADAHYRDTGGTSPIDVWLGTAHSHPGAFRIEHIGLRDFEVPFTEKGLDLKKAEPNFDIRGIHLDAHMVWGAIRAQGEINVRDMTVGLAQGGRKKTIRATGVSAGMDVTYDEPGGPPAKGRKATDPLYGLGHLTIPDADSGEIIITPDTIEVAGLQIPRLDVTSLSVGWGADGYVQAKGGKPAGGGGGGTVKTAPTGAVRLHDMKVDAKIDRKTSEIALRTMTIDHINAENIVTDLPGKGTFILGPATGTAAVLSHIKLGGPTASGFVITLGRSGLGLAGTVHVDQATIPRLSADVTGMFKGDVSLETDAIEVDLPASGKVDVRVTKPRATLLGNAELDAPTSILKSGAKAGADLFHYSSAGAELTKTTLTGLEYEDTAGGIAVKVKTAEVPGTAKIGRSGVIPELDITDADLKVDFSKRKGPAALPATNPPLAVIEEQMLDDVEGNVPLSVTLQDTPIPKLGTFDIGIALNVKTIAPGKLDLKDLRSQMVAGITFTPPSKLLSAGTHLVDFVSAGDWVHLQLTIDVVVPTPLGVFPVHYAHPILSWRLKKPSDVALFKTKEQMRLYPLIDDYVPSSSSGGPAGISLTIGPLTPTTHLDVRHSAAYDIELTSGNPTGHIWLAPDVAIGATAQGTIFPVVKPGTTGAGTLTDIALKKFEVQRTDLMVHGRRGAGTVKTGTIRIEDVKGGSLTMDGRTPHLLDLPIKKATAHDIEWTLPP